jgi:hypothetical protein
MKIKEIIKAFIPSGLLYLNKIFFLKYFINNFRKSPEILHVRENSVLIIEFFNFHGEVCPGLAKYLLDLGFNVDIVFCKYKTGRNDPDLFNCFNGNEKVRVKMLSDINMNLLLRSSLACKYKHIILTSFRDGMEREHLYKVNLFKLKIVCMMHNSGIKNDYFRTNKIISLVKIDCINRESPYIVNSHYFGEFDVNEKSKTTTFVTLNTNELYRRNLYLLFDAIDKLYENGINNFIIKIIGKGINIPEKYSGNFQNFGYLDSQVMYKEISESDFFIALIDKASVQYTNKASSSYLLSYGFFKPLLLHKRFSDVSGFNGDNGILYSDNDDLYNAMKKCIDMSNSDYMSLVSSLKSSEKKLYDISLDNLKKALETPIQFISQNRPTG